jgi:hypothetical protein
MKAAWEEELRDPLLSFVLRAGEEQRLWDPLFLKLCFGLCLEDKNLVTFIVESGGNCPFQREIFLWD